MWSKPPDHSKLPHELHSLVDKLLAHKPKPKSAGAEKRSGKNGAVGLHAFGTDI
jgi:hypothetical protein